MQQYFATYGRGALEFASKEIETRLRQRDDDGSTVVVGDAVEGKLCFSTHAKLSSIAQLKTVERVFHALLFVKFGERSLLNEVQISELISETLRETDLFTKGHFADILAIRSQSGENADPVESNNKRACTSLTFRVNVKLRGPWRNRSDFRDTLRKQIASHVQQTSIRALYIDNDTTSLSPPRFEIVCHLSECCLALGLPISEEPLSRRVYIRDVGLRSTICAIMLQLADLDRHQVVLDPFCGKGTILAENLGSARSSHFLIGSDVSRFKLDIAAQNLEFADMHRYSSTHQLVGDLVCANLLEDASLPYRAHCIDVIISDLPFGRKHDRAAYAKHNESRNTLQLSAPQRFYATILRESDRLLHDIYGSLVLLINSCEILDFENQLSHSGVNLRIMAKHALSLGDTNAHLYKLQRNVGSDNKKDATC